MGNTAPTSYNALEEGKSEAPQNQLQGLTGKAFLEALESEDENLLSKFVFLNNKKDDRDQYEGEDCFLCHRGPDTKRDLVVPLARTLTELYGYKFFVDCEAVNEHSRGFGHLDKEDVIRHALWKSRIVIVFLSRYFHESKWCLKELYTALYRKRVSPQGEYIVQIVFCDGMDPYLCESILAYSGLNLGKEFCTMFGPRQTLEQFVINPLYPTIRQLLSGDNAKQEESEIFLASWRDHCPLKPDDITQDGTIQDHELQEQKSKAPQNRLQRLTVKAFLEAPESEDEKLLSQFVFLNNKKDDRDQYEGEDCYLCHRGPETKRDLVVPLARTLTELYGYKFFVDREAVNEHSRGFGHLDKEDVIRHALWKSRVVIVFISRYFHESDWCLKELYTALYRKRDSEQGGGGGGGGYSSNCVL